MAERSVLVRIRADVSEFTAGMRVVSKGTDDASKASAKAEDAAKRHAKALKEAGVAVAAATTAIIAGFGYAVKTYSDFDTQMSAVRANLDGSELTMQALGRAAVDMSRKSTFSATEAASAITELGKAGVSTSDIMQGGLAGALNLAAVGTMSVSEAAELAASAMTQFGLRGKDIPHIADLLAAGAGKAQGSVRDLGMALSQAGLVAHATGLTIEETTGALAAFASSGLIGSDAGTSFKTMLQRLNPQSAEAKAKLSELGISAYDSTGHFVGLAKYAGELQRGMKDLSPQARDAAMQIIFGTDAVRAANVVYSQGAKGMTDWIGKVNDAGYAAEVARKQTDNLSGDLKRLRNVINAAAIDNGEGANGGLRSLVQTVTDLVRAFSDLPGPAQTAILGVVALGSMGLVAAAGIAKVVTTGRDLMDALDAIHARGGKAEAGLTGATRGAVAFGRALAALAIAAQATRFGEADGLGVQQITRDMLNAYDAVSALNDRIAQTRSSGWFNDSQVKDLGAALRFAFDPDFLAHVDGAFGSIAATFGGSDISDIAVASQRIKEIDESLAGLANGGHADKAADLFAQIAVEAKKQGIDVDELKRKFPQYAEALATAENQQKLTADGTSELAGGMSNAAKKTDDLIKSIQDLGSELLGQRDASRGFEDAIDKAAESVNKYGQNLDITTEAGRANQESLDRIAEAGKRVVESTIKMGGSQTDVQAAMQGARDSFINAATAAGMEAGEAEKLANKLGLIPANVTSAVAVPGADDANVKMRELTGYVNGLPPYAHTSVRADVYGLGDLQQAYNLISAMNGSGAHVAIAGYSTTGGSTINADGGLHELTMGRLIKAYASGGIAAIGSQQPQIRPAGGAGILWAEEGAGPWEAFVSGHPGKRARSRSIASETVSRLGGTVVWHRFADGGLMGRAAPTATPAAAIDRSVHVVAYGHSAADVAREMRMEQLASEALHPSWGV